MIDMNVKRGLVYLGGKYNNNLRMNVKKSLIYLGGKYNKQLTSPFSRAAASEPAATKSL